jgi:integrase
VRPTLRPSTYEGYKRIVDTRIVPRIGDLRLQRLSPADLQRLYAELLEDGKLNAKVDGKRVGLSPKSVRNVHAVLRHALNDALRWDLVPRNVALATDPPRSASAGAEMKTWTGEQVAEFLAYVNDDRLAALWTLYLTTGCRRGEGVGLSWDSVDLAAGRISIRHARVLAGSYDVIVSEPKTAKARRSVTLDSITVAALKAHRKAQLAERVAAESGWTDSGLVFTREDGTPLHPDAVSQRWERLVKSSGLARIRLHDARHTHATLALEAGVNPRVVADRLGHSDVSLTLGLYSHVTESVEAEAAERVANAIFGSR